jgi:branched-chain amino acid transport system substrate-binding protein
MNFVHPMETSVKVTKRFLVRSLVSAAALVAAAGSAWAQGTPVKIGLLATLEGPFAAGGADGMRGAELALIQRGGSVAGRKVEIIKGSSNANPDVAVNATRKLVEQDKVDIMVGPLSGGEGIAVKNYSKTQPQVTFINGGSGAQATTLVDPSPNFFRFNTEGAQWMVGLGKAAMDKGYKRVMVIAEDYAFPYSQVQGFMAEYCRLGGKVPVKAWVPLGGKDYASTIARIPKDVDALLVVLGGADAVNFLNQYEASGGDKPMMGGSITVSQDVLNYRGKRRDSLVGTISAGPVADSLRRRRLEGLRRRLPEELPRGQGRLPEPEPVRLRLLRQHEGGARCARHRQG